jgi:hypothetical protein
MNESDDMPEATRMTLADHLIAKARREGAFENLPGAGAPLEMLDEPYDELWWARKLIEREGLKQAIRERADK